MHASVVAVAAVVATMGMVCSAQEGGLYGMAQPPRLVRISPKGHIDPLPNPVPAEGQADELSSIDRKRGIYYIFGYNFTNRKSNVVGVDVKDGTLVVDINTPFSESAFVGVGQTIDVDPETGHLFLSGRLTETGLHHLIRFDPANGNSSNIVAIGDIDVLGGVSEYDPTSKQLFLNYGVNKSGQISIDLFAVNVETRKVTKIPEAFTNGHNLESLNYDKKTNKLYGSSGKVNSTGQFERWIGYLDPTDWKFHPIKTVTGYTGEFAGLSALNSDDRTLYVLLQKDGSTDKLAFNLVSINIDTGDLISAPTFCTLDPHAGSAPDCPWSIEFD